MTGVTITDNSGITPTVTITGSLSAVEGSYTITYKAVDAFGNETIKTRIITVSDRIAISTPEDLHNMRNNLSGKYYMLNDITLTGSTYDTWTPILDFAGSLDGNGYKIIGLKTTGTDNYVGLFGRATVNVEIKNLGITNANIQGNNSVGGLVGSTFTSGKKTILAITNCYVSGTITGNEKVGGLVGYLYSGNLTMMNSYSSANVTGSSTYVGGLVGSILDTNGLTTITKSYATGNIQGAYYVGGLVGGNNKGTIEKSYASGNVKATSYYSASPTYASAGGLVGNNSGTITNSYALGNITVVSGGNYTGGLVGRNNGTIDRVYSTGKIIGIATGTYVGPIIGYNGDSGTYSYMYWDKTTSGITSGNYGTGKTTSQMYNTQLTGFNFTSIWQPHDDSYPTLR